MSAYWALDRNTQLSGCHIPSSLRSSLLCPVSVLSSTSPVPCLLLVGIGLKLLLLLLLVSERAGVHRVVVLLLLESKCRDTGQAIDTQVRRWNEAVTRRALHSNHTTGTHRNKQPPY